MNTEDKIQNRKELAKWFLNESGTRPDASSGRVLFTYLKITTFLAAVVLALVLLIWPLVFTPEKTFNLKFSEISTEEAKTPVMENPRFHGVDKSGKPYNVTAREAIQAENNHAILKEVSGDMTMSGGKWVSLISDEGDINMDTMDTILTGNVKIISDDGFEFTTAVAYVNLNEGVANGSEPVIGQGPPGTLNSSGFEVIDGGENIIFTGPVKMVIYPGSDTGL